MLAELSIIITRLASAQRQTGQGINPFVTGLANKSINDAIKSSLKGIKIFLIFNLYRV